MGKSSGKSVMANGQKYLADRVKVSLLLGKSFDALARDKAVNICLAPNVQKF
jgi:hypothetical protein